MQWNTTALAEMQILLMELGALVCTPGTPLCTDCPLCLHCRALENDNIAHYPRRIKTKPVPTHHIAVGWWKRGTGF